MYILCKVPFSVEQESFCLSLAICLECDILEVVMQHSCQQLQLHSMKEMFPFLFICLDIYRVRIKYLIIRIMYHYSIHRLSLDGNKIIYCGMHQFLIVSILHEYPFFYWLLLAMSLVSNPWHLRRVAKSSASISSYYNMALIFRWSRFSGSKLPGGFTLSILQITPLPIFTSYSCPYSNVLLCR